MSSPRDPEPPRYLEGHLLNRPAELFQVHPISGRNQPILLSPLSMLPHIRAPKPRSSLTLKYVVEAIDHYTGYPRTQLKPEQELERDLGVDRIKKRKILSSLGIQLPPSQIKRVFDLILALDPEAKLEQTFFSSQPEQTQAWLESQNTGSSPQTHFTEKDLIPLLLRIVQEKTGYDAQTLDLDAHLESDLGIDSIKQAQILGKLRQHYPISLDSRFRIRDFPTLRHWIEWIQNRPSLLEENSDPAQTQRWIPLWKALPQESSLQPLPSLHYLLLNLPDSHHLSWRESLLSQGAHPIEMNSHLSETHPSGVEALLDFSAYFESSELSALDHIVYLLKLCQTHKSTLKVIQIFLKISSDAPSELSGALSGFAKTLALEWPHIRVQLIHLPPDATIEGMTHALRATDHPKEIRYPFQNEALREEPGWIAQPIDFLGPQAFDLHSESCVLITGGSGGIALRAAAALHQRAHCQIILVGRRPESEISSLSSWQKLQEMGAKIRYYSCDLTQPLQVQNLESTIRSHHSRVDVILHAAGVIEDGPIESKESESFQRVYNTKVQAAKYLAPWVERWKPAVFCAFTSISGVMGNPGQIDYSTANAALAAWMRQLQEKHPDVRCYCVAWGPWNQVGMTARPEVSELLGWSQDQLIPESEGVSALISELMWGGNFSEVLIQRTPAAEVLSHLSQPPGSTGNSLLEPRSSSELSASGNFYQSTRPLQPSAHPWLLDHQLMGKVILPATCSLEFFIQSTHRLLGSREVYCLNGFKILAPLITSEAHPETIQIQTRCGLNQTHWQREIVGEIRSTGQMSHQIFSQVSFPFPLSEDQYQSRHSPAQLSEKEVHSGIDPQSPFDLSSQGTDSAPLPEFIELELSSAEIYGSHTTQIPLGPAFHLISSVRWRELDGKLREAQFHLAPEHANWSSSDVRLSPLTYLLEAILHLLAVEQMRAHQLTLVPSSLQSLRWSKISEEDLKQAIHLQIQPQPEFCYDIKVMNSHSQWLASLQGLKLIDLRALGKEFFNHDSHPAV